MVWAGLDSNQRSITQRVYSLSPLATRVPTPGAYDSSAPPFPRPAGRALMPTFDVVSEVDMQEVRNAVDQATAR